MELRSDYELLCALGTGRKNIKIEHCFKQQDRMNIIGVCPSLSLVQIIAHSRAFDAIVRFRCVLVHWTGSECPIVHDIQFLRQCEYFCNFRECTRQTRNKNEISEILVSSIRITFSKFF